MSILTTEMVSALAKQLNIVEPIPSHPRYDTPIARLHEVGHFAVKSVPWYLRWCAALKPRQLAMAGSCGCPWLPTIEYISADPLPDEYGVQLWVVLVLQSMELQRFLDPRKAVVMGDSAEQSFEFCPEPTWGHGKDPWVQLSEWNIDPLKDKLLPTDDGFSLPYPDGCVWHQIIDNFCAIQAHYPDRVPHKIDYLTAIKGARLEALMQRFPG